MTISKILKNKTFLAVCIIMLLGIVLRFYNFPLRWGPGDDDTRDVMLAYQALLHHELPLTGSFSSAGPFLFGPLFYWFIMLSILIFPFSPLSPYIFTGVVSSLTILVFFFIGKRLSGTWGGIITAFFAAISPQLVVRGIILGQHSYVAIFTAFLILSLIMVWQTKKSMWAFLAGLSIGFALSMHYQAINLLFLFPFVLFVPKSTWKEKLQYVLFMVLGFLIPTIPYLYWESGQSFANTRNILDYFLIGQYRLYVPNSWKLFLFQFLPSYWSFVIGGLPFISGLIMANIVVVTVWALYKKQLPLILKAFGIVLLLFLILNRYYHGERSEGYLMYLNPFLITFSAWTVSFWFNTAKKMNYLLPAQVIGTLLLSIIVIGNAYALTSQLSHTGLSRLFLQATSTLEKKYPGKNITIYDYQWKTPWYAYPVSLFLTYDKKESSDGVPIGVFVEDPKVGLDMQFPIVWHNGDLKFVVLDQEAVQDKKTWVNMSGEALYADFRTWNYDHRLTSSFSLLGYIANRLKIHK